MMPLVTVVTPTVCTKHLQQAMDSVANQTYKNIQHLVVIDGIQLGRPPAGKAGSVDILQLPYNTGHSQYNGHRIYGMAPFLAKGEYICYLDEDNWMDTEHIERLVEVVGPGKADWAYSLRKIVDEDGNYICNDDCESLGNWSSVLSGNDNFVDVNCFFLPTKLALTFSPGWYRRARHPDEQPEVDRLLSWFLIHQNGGTNTKKLNIGWSGKYTINYRVGSRADSVQAQFFLKGNAKKAEWTNNEYPWRK